MFKVGDRVKTTASGMQGIITGYSQRMDIVKYSVTWGGFESLPRVYCWLERELIVLLDGNDIMKELCSK